MKQKVFLLFLLIFMFIGMSAYATPLMVMDGTNVLEINGVDYTITDNNISGTPYSLNGDFIGYIDDTWSGVYLGTITEPTNNSITDMENLIGYFLDDINYTMVAFDKYDVGEVPALDEDGLGVLQVNLADKTWSSPIGINFYSVKGANEFALYFIEGEAAMSGKYTTEHVNTPGDSGNNAGLSHLMTVYDNVPVPEPTALILIGLGMVGFAGLRTKKRS